MRGYWADHDYTRLKVEDIEEFVGWRPLLQVVKAASRPRNQGFLATVFLTGGRISEVLPLKKENFEVLKEEGLILVQGMSLLKRYEKLEEYVDAEGNKRWKTETIKAERKPFPVVIKEPLVPYLLTWLDRVDDLLFPSPVNLGQPLTRSWAYQWLLRLNQKLSPRLRKRLGFINRKGQEVAHLWPHWFRAQRASQLVNDYGFEVMDLLGFFMWEKDETALHYAKRGWRGLADKMKMRKPSYR